MKTIDYSAVRYELTEALRNLEALYESLENYETHFASEVDYWISSIELIRQCLYGCTKHYEGELNLLMSIKEIKNEISNAYALKYSWLTEVQQNKLRFAWLRLEKSEGHLKK